MLSFHFVDGFFCCSQAFQFSVVPLVYYFVAFAICVKSKKSSLRLMPRSLLISFPSSFVVLGFSQRFLTYFGLIFCTWYKIVAWFNSSCVSFLFNFYFILEYGCFTIFYQFQGYSKVIPLYKYIYIYVYIYIYTYIYIYPFLFRFFSHIGYYRILNRIHWAKEQVLVDFLFHIQ